LYAEIRYKPWGDQRYTNGTATPTTYQFTGQRRESQLGGTHGLYFYTSRWYDPAVGRFLSADTLVPGASNPQNLNRYTYANNTPTRYTDPSGHWIESALDIAGIAYDLWDISQNGLNWENGLSLAADVGGLILPGFTGGGVIVRALTKADDVVDAAKAVNAAANGAQAAGQAINAAQAASGAGNAVQAANQLDNAADTLSHADDAVEYVRAVPVDQVGTSQPFKLRSGEDGISVFENVRPDEVLAELPGGRVPNTTVTIPKDALPPGTKAIPTPAPGLSQYLSDAHRVLIRPEGWSADRFAKTLKQIVGWE
jgi:RHS repeat-associated protein